MEERLQRKIDARNKTTITIQYYYVQQKTDQNFWCKYDDAMQITYIDNFISISNQYDFFKHLRYGHIYQCKI